MRFHATPFFECQVRLFIALDGYKKLHVLKYIKQTSRSCFDSTTCLQKIARLACHKRWSNALLRSRKCIQHAHVLLSPTQKYRLRYLRDYEIGTSEKQAHFKKNTPGPNVTRITPCTLPTTVPESTASFLEELADHGRLAAAEVV